VEDPVARGCLAKGVTATTLEGQGPQCYFLGEETGREFSEKNKIAIK
jgi:hypothetical protein